MPNSVTTQTTSVPSTTNTSGLAGQAANQNISAAGDIGTLTNLLQQINQNAYLSAPGRSQELGTIQNELAGNLDPSTIYQNQLRNAEQYGAGGFSADSQAWQTAIQRGLGIDRQNLINAGQQAMDKFYSGMPTVDASSQIATPALLEQQQATQGSQALQAQQIANQASQFGQTLGQNQANLYAQTYGTIPGYNQYGQFTGQTGTYPTAAQLNSSAFPTTGVTTAATTATPAASTTAAGRGGAFDWASYLQNQMAELTDPTSMASRAQTYRQQHFSML
jgi:hypothetical protein